MALPQGTIAVETVPIPEPGPGKIRIRLQAASVNPVDAMVSFWGGLLPQPPPAPFILGVDGAGVVDAVGEGAGWSVGDRVVVHANLLEGAGTFAQYCVAHSQACVRIPDSITFQDAAALPCAGWTAYKALLTKLRVDTPSSLPRSILITSGNGGVGGFAIQIAKHFGLCPIIATCSPGSAARVTGLGATHTIDYNSPDIIAAVRAICPAGVDYCVDCVSSESATALLSSLALDGQLATIAGVVTRGGDGDTYLKGVSVHDVCLGPVAYGQGSSLLWGLNVFGWWKLVP